MQGITDGHGPIPDYVRGLHAETRKMQKPNQGSEKKRDSPEIRRYRWFIGRKRRLHAASRTKVDRRASRNGYLCTNIVQFLVKAFSSPAQGRVSACKALTQARALQVKCRVSTALHLGVAVQNARGEAVFSPVNVIQLYLA